MKDDYSDIIDMPYKKSDKYPHMSRIDRGAQFAPFSALTGYDDTVKEAGRRTDIRLELDQQEIDAINRCLNIISENMQVCGRVKITFFMPDKRKNGGVYRTLCDSVVAIDLYEHTVTLKCGEKIVMSDIYSLTLLDKSE